MGIANLAVVYTLSEEAWVNFKLFGMLGCTLVFVISQGIYISRHMPEQEENSGEN
jgi:intracellular septation protein